MVGLRFLLVLLFLSLSSCFTILRSDRKIRIDNHIVRSVSTLSVTHNKDKEVFEWSVAPWKKGKLANIDATVGSKQLTVQKGEETSEGTIYRISVQYKKGEPIELKVKEVFIDSLDPLPNEISQSENQYVKFIDNHFLWTGYAVDSQKTEIKLSSNAIESHSQEKPTVAKGDTITYGDYGKKDAFARSKLSVHFKNDAPFVTADSMVKEIEISHWGNNVAVTEEYMLHNTGAKLKGGFSRFDYQSSGAAYISRPVIQSLKGKLPYGASDLYYRDAIGNVSTSVVHGTFPESTIELFPRFPLFGGWRDAFYYGYNLPAARYLFRSTSDPQQFLLNMTLASPFKDLAIRNLTVRIILPEGASAFETKVPFGVDSTDSRGLRPTYLDASGRPVIEIRKSNVVTEHNKIFQVSYHFSTSSQLREPMMLFVAFFAFFVICIIYTRLDLSIKSHAASAPAAKKNE